MISAMCLDFFMFYVLLLHPLDSKFMESSTMLILFNVVTSIHVRILEASTCSIEGVSPTICKDLEMKISNHWLSQ